MDISKLENYLSKFANKTSTERAKNYHPVLLGYDEQRASYTCENNNGTTYRVYIYEVKGMITSSCSCPYDQGGICKHTIAAINDLFQYLNGKKTFVIKNKVEPVSNVDDYFVILNDHRLDPSELKSKIKLIRDSGYYHDIISVSQQEVSIKLGAWENVIANLKYEKDTQKLYYKCSCNKKNIFCSHIFEAGKIIINTFGADFFHPSYLDNYIENYLKPHNLTLKDNYQKYFDFSFSKKGVVVKHNFQNIVTSVDDLFKKDRSVKIFSDNNEIEQFGYAGVFGFSGKKFKKFFITKAKLNKNGDDLISKFENINQDVEKFITKLEDNPIQKIYLKSIKINQLMGGVENQYFQKLVQAGDAYNEIIKDFPDFKFYQYDEYESLTKKNLQLLIIHEPVEIEVFMKLSDKDLYITANSYLRLLDKNYNLSNPSPLKIRPFYLQIKDSIYPIKNTQILPDLYQISQNTEFNFVKTDTKKLVTDIVKPLSKKFRIQSNLIPTSKKLVDDAGLEKHVYIKDFEGQYLYFRLAVLYPQGLIDVLTPELLLENDNETYTIIERNEAYEDNFLEEFQMLHPHFEEQSYNFMLSVTNVLENFWLIHATDKMKQIGIKVFGVNELKSFKFNINKPVISMGVKSDIDWFDLNLQISFGNQKASLKEVQKAILKKSNYVALDDGSLGVLPEEWVKKMSGYFKTGEVRKDHIKLSQFHFGIIEELYNELDTKPKFLTQLYERKKRLENLDAMKEIPLPKGVKAQLRPYQMSGFQWLNFMDDHKLGACLADDMGLGKTLQTLTFILHLIAVKKVKKPILIIAPTSLMFNWKNEIEKFTPQLKYLIYTGLKRGELKDEITKNQLIISTYGSLLNDVEYLKDINFQYVILDESQAIKNPNSKRYKAVRLLQSENRMVLTGTPIENNTFDLYAQLNFLNPGLLNSISHFKTQFSDDIDKEKNENTSQLLSKMISPFVLRRTKEQVAKDLPEKTESILYCEMGKEQRAVYESFKEKYQKYLLDKINEAGIEKSQMYILEGLTKLRQICNATNILSDEEDYGNYSVKIEMLIENVKEKTGNHKILIFSQFVKMLNLIKENLEQHNITYEYLDGQTTDRENRVNNFQNNTNIRVFLISLKAGGTGLNLTEADYVFIVDPWWNPAVENQAIDRTHRIGQTRPVMAYRMICKDTIEEKILNLQQKKKRVASSIVQVDNEVKSFDIKQVKELFS